ncbi:MAG: helix-turn-helix domain-containing protein [Bdellovibrionaceae bacterium]|nr:helix-turn-helix domain-containing protein [Pseudobdellovibrionaceae bacterium]
MSPLVRTLMNLKGVTQAELAKSSDVSVAALSRFLNGSSELRSNSFIRMLSVLGLNISEVLKKEVSKTMGSEGESSIEEDFKVLLERVSPLERKTISDTLIASLKNEKDPDTVSRINRVKKYRDSIKTVRRKVC